MLKAFFCESASTGKAKEHTKTGFTFPRAVFIHPTACHAGDCERRPTESSTDISTELLAGLSRKRQRNSQHIGTANGTVSEIMDGSVCPIELFMELSADVSTELLLELSAKLHY